MQTKHERELSVPPPSVVDMFEELDERPLTTADLAHVKGALGSVAGATDAERIDQIRLLEEIKAAAAAAQARLTCDFVESQIAEQRAAGVPSDALGRGVASQVGLAKRESPARAMKYVGWADVLTKELPHTYAALQAGVITEWRAKIVAKETSWLRLEDRLEVDRTLALRLEMMGDRRLEAEVRKLAARLDPHGASVRVTKAEADRRVTLRPAPDSMTLLTGLLPVAQGVALFATLRKKADSLRARGDARTRGQIMADLLVQRVTGHAEPDAIPVGINLVMTDTSLFGHGDAEPAQLEGYGPIPADLARRLVRAGAGAAVAGSSWLRRLYTDPRTVQLIAMTSKQRIFPEALADFLVIRDQICRTPWCNAPVRHLDHVVPVEDGGETSEANGEGLCEACNYTKEMLEWHSRPRGSGAGDQVEITTPTGHKYLSHPPDPPGKRSRGERLMVDLFWAA